MVESENKLFSMKDNWVSQKMGEQQRLKVLSDLGLLQPETIPVFEEATQTAVHLLEAQICILGFVDQERHWFKSSVGLSKLRGGIMNHLAQSRELLRQESFCTKVIESAQPFIINDTHQLTTADSSDYSKLIQDYGIRSYLGAPLFDASGHCLGALAIMDTKPRNFTGKDIEFIQVIARWSMSEFERNRLLETTSNPTLSSSLSNFSQKHIVNTTEIKISPSTQKDLVPTNQLKLELLGQLIQELRTPLTSVLGMASVLGREIYGPLTNKQREYVEIIQHSGRYLLSLVNEISQMGSMEENPTELNLASVDVEMLCQQVLSTLEEAVNRREQDLRFSIEPGRSRICSLDKDKVRQILYHLIFSVIQLSATGSIVRIHVSSKEDTLNITVWVSHPWLGEGITEVDPLFCHSRTLPLRKLTREKSSYGSHFKDLEQTPDLSVIVDMPNESITKPHGHLSRESLGLLLSCHFAELHGGQIAIQGSSESGYRYVLSLPLNLGTPDAASDV
ncbi:GAF domain-containing sensor histidine kinase [Brasilonema sp. UFV-L1]|uniref:GAF domain-containing sensor histidine kinase n=1 Tax=Brasilonema sp. UFV-L1 TaxID=2234130 RepID=UPI00145EB0C7|nr:GAF domain-containing sensor histidine kinase [Brasilonema sp. UFV-L1]NMG07331.1 histidine kinase [Brasilonema sp. UFV-L1]